jgi:RNA polymerase sigma-70 factor (ECF subfamily)
VILAPYADHLFIHGEFFVKKFALVLEEYFMTPDCDIGSGALLDTSSLRGAETKDRPADIISAGPSHRSLIDVLIGREMPRLRRFAWHLVHDDDHADDLLQDTIVRVLLYATKWQPGTNFGAWARRIMRNQFYCDHRQRGGVPPAVSLDDVPEPVIPPSQLAALECGEWQVEIERLPTSQRSVLKMTAFEGLQCEEIAGHLRISADAVRCHLLRGRKRLREVAAVGRSGATGRTARFG